MRIQEKAANITLIAEYLGINVSNQLRGKVLGKGRGAASSDTGGAFQKKRLPLKA